ncbi:uncharacterized protein LOC121265876 [Juglans microcarpa x Juglans regia]|uniref:uncharacterized protein LOC121265876 n=1 Tax=Juglans microcarpa x Juglans regia TaxID=2249226 RepID=UPI001B7E7D5A|nr:uncharacterized protein LOC121265876 [Juglans microcarpa x Juglans regia]
MFLWRACQEALPTQSNLFKKKVVSHPLCPICNLEKEDAYHATWGCESAKDVWSLCSKSLQKCHFPHMSMIQLIEALFQIMESKTIQEFAVVVSKIWWRRNTLVFKGVFAHPKVIMHEARTTLDVLDEENSNHGARANMIYTSAETCQAPPLDWIKLNWDSAIDKARGLVGVGVVVRNSLGRIIATLRTKKHLYPDPLLAEAFGALKTMQFGLELGFT